MKPDLFPSRVPVVIFACALFSIPYVGSAQTVPASTASPAAPSKDEVIELTPFEVRGDTDTGYLSFDTASGSRLNTKLRDTPAAISVFTAEFLSDIAATNVADVAKYASNTEYDVGFISGSPNGNQMMNAAQNLTVRGLPTTGGPASGRTVNFLSYPIEIDVYNTSRVEFSRGPNSILFGLGQPGGTFNTQSRTADPNRSIFSATVQTGSWNNFRALIDANVPLIKKKLAVRLDAVTEHSAGWRPWEYNDNKRLYAALRYQVARHTTIDLESEIVKQNFNRPRPYLGPDHISAWLKAGRPLVSAPSTSSTPDLVTGIRRVSSSNQYSFIAGGASAGTTPLLVNFLNTARTANPLNVTRLTPMLQDFSVVPMRSVLAGAGTYNKFHFSNHTALVRHEFTPNLYTEFAVNQSVYNSDQRDINGPDLALWYDPNTQLYNNPGGGTAATIPNPNAGKPYVEMYLQKRQSMDRRTDFRDTIAYRLNLGEIFGDHQFGALGEHWEQKTRSATYVPSFFDRPPVPNAPENASNLVWQRTYVDLSGPAENIGLANINPETFPGVKYITKATPSYNRYYLNSWMLATQSKFWKDRIVVTLGNRHDYLYSKLSNAVRESTLKGGYTLGFLTPGPASAYKYKAETRTGGVVFHVTKWTSLYVNKSNNIALPALNQFTIPKSPVPSPRGKTEDVGGLLTLFSGRFTARITYYETAVVNNSTSLGTGNVQDHINAIWGTLFAAGKITQAQYNDNLTQANAYNFDNSSQGWEGEVIANLTPAWRLLFNVSTNKTSLTNVATSIRSYIAANRSTWTDSALPAAIDRLRQLDDYVTPNLINVDGGQLPLTPKWIANARTDYSFRTGALKGFNLGAGARTRADTFLGYTSDNPATRRELTAGSYTVVDGNIGYATRLGWRGKDHKLKFQLNVNNLFDNQRLIAQTANSSNQVLNYRFQTPRQILVRATVDY
jgi:outer membrane receptor protein involved in Fe transport